MESLAEQWNRDQSSNTKSNVTCVVSQATSYASVAGIKYFVISTYEVTWLAQVLRPGVIAITRGFASEATCPSVLQVGLHLHVRQGCHLLRVVHTWHAGPVVPDSHHLQALRCAWYAVLSATEQ
jgi:hypothetical protein